jgi:hypothetical protein
VGFEPTIPAFERAKIVQALDRETTVIDQFKNTLNLNRPKATVPSKNHAVDVFSLHNTRGQVSVNCFTFSSLEEAAKSRRAPKLCIQVRGSWTTWPPHHVTDDTRTPTYQRSLPPEAMDTKRSFRTLGPDK